MAWMQETTDGVLLHLRVTPRAHKNEIRGVHGDRLKVYLQSPPVDGKANQMLITFLSKQLSVSASSIELVRGEKSREKTIFIAGLSPADISARMDAST